MKSGAIRLTMAQALVRFLRAQKVEIDRVRTPFFAGVWAIFGHGNVAALGEALYASRTELPVLRAHDEQGMAHAAAAYAKASRRMRAMVCTSSIGPGATNMVTAAAVAHVNRLPLLLLPADVFANRDPDPVLQQIERFDDGLVSANDCLRPVSRYFDRITRPEQIVPALRRAMQVLTDAADCGPVTLCLCQDVQAEAYDYPESAFAERVWGRRRLGPDKYELRAAADILRTAQTPLIIAGGGVLYAAAETELCAFARKHGIPVAETQAGKSSLAASEAIAVGGIGVTGTAAANALGEKADVVLAIGSRLQDFTTGSRTLFKAARHLIGLNVQPFDAGKHGSLPLVCDALLGLKGLGASLVDWQCPATWTASALDRKNEWLKAVEQITAKTETALPSDAQVIGVVQRAGLPSDIVVAAAGGLPGELHKLWNPGAPCGYHVEYGYSCMGYEIAGGIGAKLAHPGREVVVMLGDGSYLMMNSELATSITLGTKLIVVLLDNHGFGCIERLQSASGGASFNNLRAVAGTTEPQIDFVAHAISLGARARKVVGLDALEAALADARASDRTFVIVIETDPSQAAGIGGHWWNVVVPEISERAEVNHARKQYDDVRGS